MSDTWEPQRGDIAIPRYKGGYYVTVVDVKPQGEVLVGPYSSTVIDPETVVFIQHTEGRNGPETSRPVVNRRHVFVERFELLLRGTDLQPELASGG